MIEEMEEKVFEHDNFVWLDHEAVNEILIKRKAGSCEAMTIYNNLLRWSLYQLDRNACTEVDEKTGNDIPIEVRLDWIRQCRNGAFDDYLNVTDLKKYLGRGLKMMPWTELSQKDFLNYVVEPGEMMEDEAELLQTSISLMKIVVGNPERLGKSAFEVSKPKTPQANKITLAPVIKSVKAPSDNNGGKITSLFSRRDTVKKINCSLPRQDLAQVMEESSDAGQPIRTA